MTGSLDAHLNIGDCRIFLCVLDLLEHVRRDLRSSFLPAEAMMVSKEVPQGTYERQACLPAHLPSFPTLVASAKP
jgi:hypothetical protein